MTLEHSHKHRCSQSVCTLLPSFHKWRKWTDVDAWREMLETTLAHLDKVNFDLAVYAAGLADTVLHGGAYTKDKCLHVEVPHEQWVKGLPVKLDYEAMFRELLAGRRPRRPNDYKLACPLFDNGRDGGDEICA